jgi:hypothetical protein
MDGNPESAIQFLRVLYIYDERTSKCGPHWHNSSTRASLASILNVSASFPKDESVILATVKSLLIIMVERRFAYLPYLAVLLFVEYVLLVLFFWRRRNRRSRGVARNGKDVRVASSFDVMNPLGIDIEPDEDFLSSFSAEASPDLGSTAAGDDESDYYATQRLRKRKARGVVIGCGSCSLELLDSKTIMDPFNFETTFLSYGVWTERLLLFNRVLSFGYLCGVGVWFRAQLQEIRLQNVGWEFFTSWNLYMLSLYYLLAIICSCIGQQTRRRNGQQVGEETRNAWSGWCRALGCTVYLLYEVLGATAFMVTTVAFTLLDPNPTFWNCTFHLATTISIILELLLNKMTVTFMHFPFGLTWALVYTSFIWLAVWLGAVPQWPYMFLDTSSPLCFLWYSGLVMCFIFYYCLFAAVSQRKMRYHEAYLRVLEENKQTNIHTDLLAAKDNTHTKSGEGYGEKS